MTAANKGLLTARGQLVCIYGDCTNLAKGGAYCDACRPVNTAPKPSKFWNGFWCFWFGHQNSTNYAHDYPVCTTVCRACGLTKDHWIG